MANASAHRRGRNNLNPAKIGGYGVVALYCVGIFVLFLIFALVFQSLGNRLPRLVKG